MSSLRDLPPISGAIIWARQIGNLFVSNLLSTMGFHHNQQTKFRSSFFSLNFPLSLSLSLSLSAQNDSSKLT
jgi:hypothetical protein